MKLYLYSSLEIPTQAILILFSQTPPKNETKISEVSLHKEIEGNKTWNMNVI